MRNINQKIEQFEKKYIDVNDGILDKISNFFKAQKIYKKDFFAEFFPDVKYEKNSGEFTDSIYNLQDSLNLYRGVINSYDRLVYEQFHIGCNKKYLDNSYKIFGKEIKTEKKHKDQNGRVRYTVNNHFYVYKFEFDKTLSLTKSPIFIGADMFDSKLGILKSGFMNLLISAIITLVLFFLKMTIFADAGFLTINFLISAFLVSFICLSLIRGRANRVKLENPGFEKYFDIYSKDQIQTRKLLTPEVMVRFLDSLKEINYDKNYKFMISGNKIYIFINLINGKTHIQINEGNSIKDDLQTAIKEFDFISNFLEKLDLSHMFK